jgi:hypothetical protein
VLNYALGKMYLIVRSVIRESKITISELKFPLSLTGFSLRSESRIYFAGSSDFEVVSTCAG